MKKTLAFISLLLAHSLALAGPQYVDETGFAASGYDVVAFRSLEQSSVGTGQPEAIPGSAGIVAEYNGSKWAFATEENRDTFLADPARYAPVYDGHCAFGVAQGGKVPGNPNLWRIVDDKLYFNINPQVVGLWEADIPGQIVSADSNWIKAESKRASKKSWKKMKANKGTYSKVAPL
jgi:YHS domain-containing protein